LNSILGFSQGEIPIKNHHLIIDKTGSMNGYNGATNIWSKVKEAALTYIKNVPDGEKVSIYTFHRTLDPKKTYKIDDESRIGALNFVKSINADGNWTCTYSALSEAFNGLNKNEMNIIQLFTDGRDSGKNTCGDKTLSTAIETYNLKRGNYDYLFYITLNVPADPNLQKTIDATKSASVINGERGKVPTINILSPKSLNLVYSKDNLTLNQGFDIYSSSSLPEGLTVEIDPRYVKIESLSKTDWNPEFTRTIYSVSQNEELTLSFLNSVKNLPEGVYLGSYKYKKDDRYFVIPEEVKLEYRHIPKSTVTIEFKDPEK
jgi:hypothetical protein